MKYISLLDTKGYLPKWQKLAEKGVDGIVSDRPDILKGLSTAVTRYA
jgi:hypothetical protein